MAFRSAWIAAWSIDGLKMWTFGPKSGVPGGAASACIATDVAQAAIASTPRHQQCTNSAQCHVISLHKLTPAAVHTSPALYVIAAPPSLARSGRATNVPRGP